MILSSLLALSALAGTPDVPPALAIERVEVRVTTGSDDLREDSSARVSLEYANGERQSLALDKVGETLGAGQKKTLTFTPPRATFELGDLYRVRIDFHSGRATGFDDHWKVEAVDVAATVNGTKTFLFNRRLGMHLKYTQNWASPYFLTATVADTVNPSEIWTEGEGGHGPSDQSSVFIDIETDDGYAWHGRRTGSQYNTPVYSGARVEARITDRIAVQSIRAIRIGFRSSQNDEWLMRGVRIKYKDQSGNTRDLASFNEINVAFKQGGWWQAPFFRKMKRNPGTPISAMVVELLSGPDDLRRLSRSEDPRDNYSSKVDITFSVPVLNPPRYANWIVDGDNARRVANRIQPIIQQDSDEFPQGWAGSFAAFERFSKVFTSRGQPFFLSSDLLNVSVKFKQGGGGNFTLTGDRGGGIVGAFREPDKWEMQGIIVSVQGPTGGLRRIFSDFTVNKYMSRDNDVWRSPNFETLLLRNLPPP